VDERLRILLFWAFCGAVAAAGLLCIAVWRILMTSPNAGAMVGGVFHPYAQDTSGHVITIGGAAPLLGGLGGLVWAWRKIGRDQAL
jgi:hypothetical protein